jgi:SH3 domain-containing protein
VKIEIDRVRGFDDPRTKAACTIELKKGDEVIVIGRGHEGWVLVETAAGDIGWIPASVVADAGQFAGDPRRERAAAAAPAAAPPAAEPSLPRRAAAPPSRIDAHLVATAGAETFALRQADAMAIASGPLGAVAAAARVRAASQLWVGVAGNAGLASGDLTYYDATERSQPMATRDLVIDASAEVGWGRAWSIAARGGYHYATLDVESERTEPMLVGARISGATVGLGATAPLGRRFAVAAAIDVMPAGDHAPAEAGIAAATSVRGAWARGTLTARLSAHLAAALAYRGGAVDATLPDGTARSDRTHAVTAGLGVTW